MTYVLNRNFYIRSPADVYSQCFDFLAITDLAILYSSSICRIVLSLRFVLRMRWRFVGSVSDRTPSLSLSQADGIQSIDTIPLMERGARALQVLHVLSEFAGLSVPIRVSEWQKDGGGMELSVRGMLVKMLVKKVESKQMTSAREQLDSFLPQNQVSRWYNREEIKIATISNAVH